MAIPLALVAEGALKGIGKLTGAMDRLTGIFTRSMAFADDSQKASLALGTTYEKVSKQFVGTVQGLRGDIHTKFAGAFKAMEAGLQGNSAGVAKLINQQMLTGTQYARTATAFASLHDIAGVQTDGMNRLASSFVETGNKYGVATDVLVNALNSLAESFPAARLAGLGSQFFGAVTQLQAELGPAMAGPLNSVMSMVMDTSLNGYQKLVTLGIGGVREQLMAAQSTADQVAIMKNAMIIAGDRFASVAGDVKTGYFKLGVAADVFGKEAMMMRVIQQQFAENARDTNKQTVDYAKQLSVLGKEVITPIIEVLSEEFYPKVLEAADLLSDVGKRISEAFAGWIKRLPDGEEAFKKFMINVLETGKSITGTLANALDSMATTLYMNIIPALVNFSTFLKEVLPEHWIDPQHAAFMDLLGGGFTAGIDARGMPKDFGFHLQELFGGLNVEEQKTRAEIIMNAGRRLEIAAAQLHRIDPTTAALLYPERRGDFGFGMGWEAAQDQERFPGMRQTMLGPEAHGAYDEFYTAFISRLAERMFAFGESPTNIDKVLKSVKADPQFMWESITEALFAKSGLITGASTYDLDKIRAILGTKAGMDEYLDIHRLAMGLRSTADMHSTWQGLEERVWDPALTALREGLPIARESSAYLESIDAHTSVAAEGAQFMSESVMQLGEVVDAMLGRGPEGATLNDVLEALGMGNILSDRMVRRIEAGGYVVPATSR